VIRLWNRVGLFRTLSVLVLLSGLVGGFLISDRHSQRRVTASNPTSAHAADVPQSQQDVADQADAQQKADDAAIAAAAQAKAAQDASRTKQPASRSDQRTGGTAGPVPASCQVYSGNRATGCTLMLQAGFGIDQAPCLVNLWNRESGWNERARNPGSGAYGIPQANPGSKMGVYGSDWQTNPVTQIKWGLNYIKQRYQTPCGAWSHFQSAGWY
jgi:hypothetical protein